MSGTAHPFPGLQLPGDFTFQTGTAQSAAGGSLALPTAAWGSAAVGPKQTSTAHGIHNLMLPQLPPPIAARSPSHQQQHDQQQQLRSLHGSGILPPDVVTNQDELLCAANSQGGGTAPDLQLHTRAAAASSGACSSAAAAPKASSPASSSQQRKCSGATKSSGPQPETSAATSDAEYKDPGSLHLQQLRDAGQPVKLGLRGHRLLQPGQFEFEVDKKLGDGGQSSVWHVSGSLAAGLRGDSTGRVPVVMTADPESAAAAGSSQQAGHHSYVLKFPNMDCSGKGSDRSASSQLLETGTVEQAQQQEGGGVNHQQQLGSVPGSRGQQQSQQLVMQSPLKHQLLGGVIGGSAELAASQSGLSLKVPPVVEQAEQEAWRLIKNEYDCMRMVNSKHVLQVHAIGVMQVTINAQQQAPQHQQQQGEDDQQQQPPQHVLHFPCLLLEHAPYGTLRDFMAITNGLREDKSGAAQWETRLIMKQTLLAVKASHDNFVMHRDISPGELAWAGTAWVMLLPCKHSTCCQDNLWQYGVS